MSRKAEADDLGERMYVGHFGERLARRVELGRPLQHLGVPRLRKLSFLQRRRQDAYPQRLAEDQRIARFRGAVALHLVGMHEAEDDQAVDGLQRVDRVAARDRDARRGAHRLAAGEDLPDHRERQLLERHADDGERQDRPAAHGIDVGDGVGRGDAAEVVRLIDDRREEVGRGDDRLRVVQPIDRGVVRRLEADHEVLRQPADRRGRQDLGEDSGRDLAAAAAAMAVFSEADLLGSVHASILQVRKPAKTSPRSGV